MQRSLLLPVALLLLLHMASQASATPLEDTINAFPDQVHGSHYPDPDNLLESLRNICSICGSHIHFCSCVQVPQLSLWTQMNNTINPNQLYSQPMNPQDPHLLSPQSHYGSQYGQSIPQAAAPLMVRVPSAPNLYHGSSSQNTPIRRHISDPRSSRYPYPSSSADVWNNASPMEGFMDSTYNAGDRTQKSKRKPPQQNGYPCFADKCDQTFNRECDLRRHMKTHADHSERPYECTICNRRFHYPKDVTRHMKKHEPGEKFYCPYQDCKSSVTGFGRLDNLNRHVRKSHDSRSSHRSSNSAYAASNSGASTH